MNPQAKATLATGVFALFGLVSLLFLAPAGPIIIPHAIFYAVLVLNTFFSIRFYAGIQPQSFPQMFIDVVLVVAYIAVALSIGQAFLFAWTALFLFVAAPIKYALMLVTIHHRELLQRKIFIDSMGAVSCAVFLVFTMLGYPLEAAWVFAIVFSLANVYLLLIHPMYRL
ncbi:MAG: hypothetical protein Q7S08_00100 [bacterium]|nr:hypothetical protein [bacterium]